MVAKKKGKELILWGPVFLDSNGTFGITLSFALIGGISISISGELFYEGNE